MRVGGKTVQKKPGKRDFAAVPVDGYDSRCYVGGDGVSVFSRDCDRNAADLSAHDKIRGKIRYISC